ncbi:hypothetical protein L2Y94_20355 [Luteibacter aegosomatis]|uniref:hypothetical protein n=1 Tax=Luteibacter aegosomatis TaxID=2911537 RepID=UPI001FF8E8BD|nr:hypothetical protein [Luteibacter aegosomatis]UPG85614.1 hypothetical protein L2Y94_20355 [Luteibacter aegosomatis]
MIPYARMLLAFAVGACAAAPALARGDDPAARLAKITEGRVAGKPQRCIVLSTTYSSQIIDKTTLVFRVGNTYYVNQPKSGAKSLDDNDLPVIRTFGSQLCELDSVDLIDRFAGGLRGFVILGPFVPYKPAPKTQ